MTRQVPVRRQVLLVALLLASGCTSAPTTPTVVTPAPVVREVQYAINVPSVALLVELRRAYPGGVRLAPLDAQRAWDYTAAYGGTPNVYAGESSPPCGYPHVYVGIVIAPRRVAGLTTFTAADWPGIGLEVGVTFAWVGQFAFALVAPPGSYTIDPACARLLGLAP